MNMNIYIHTNIRYYIIYVCLKGKRDNDGKSASLKRNFIFSLLFLSIVMLVSGVYFQSFEMIRNDMTWYEMIVELMKVEGRTYPLLSALCLPLSCRVTDKHGSQTTTELVNHMTWFKSKIPNRRLIDKIQPRDCKMPSTYLHPDSNW